MTREERIKVLEHYNNILIVSNYDKTKLRTVKALEQAISDMQILDKIEKKCKEDITFYKNSMNNDESKQLMNLKIARMEENKYILDLIGGKNNE